MEKDKLNRESQEQAKEENKDTQKIKEVPIFSNIMPKNVYKPLPRFNGNCKHC